MKILNIAAGKLKPINPPDKGFLINLDTMYFDSHYVKYIEREESLYDPSDTPGIVEYYCKEDVFTFMSRTKIIFDKITCYRFLEHVDSDKVLYFIYLMSTCLRLGGDVDIIVPNYKTLAKIILDEVPGEPDWEAKNILTTTEVLNERNDPHTSIWTSDRLKYFFELEGRFYVTSIEPYNFDGRDIYLRFIGHKIK